MRGRVTKFTFFGPSGAQEMLIFIHSVKVILKLQIFIFLAHVFKLLSLSSLPLELCAYLDRLSQKYSVLLILLTPRLQIHVSAVSRW